MMKLIKLGVVLGAVYVAVLAVIFVLMGRSNAIAGKALSLVPGPAFMALPMETMWCLARRGSLAVGQPAPDFELPTRDGKDRVRLSALRGGKPVVLVFASYSCPPFRREMPAVNEVYRQFEGRASFYFVYVSEAHATDVWPVASNAREKILYATHASLGERVAAANTCATAMKVEFPMLVDELGDGVDRDYTAWPTRIYVVGSDGRIVYKSRPGPFGFEAGPLRDALAGLVPAPAPTANPGA